MTMPADQGGAAPTVTYAYDLTGALLTQDYAAADTPDVSFQYNDSLGRLTRMTDGQGQTNYGYHPINSAGMGALKTINGPWANDTIEMLFDAAGRNSGYQIKNDAGNVLSYSEMTFDAKERVANITDNLGVHVIGYEGDTSRVLGVSTKDANDLTREILNRAYAYHTPQDGNRLASITNLRGAGTAAGATQISKFGYTYTPTGQIDTWTQELGLAGNDATTSIWDIDYDPLYQLKDVKITAPDGTLRNSYSYGYDEAGNRIRETVDTATTTARHNSRNEIFETGGGTRTMVEGTINRPATVTVNGQSARLKPLSGGMEYLFQKEIPVAEGENEIEVTATDQAGATTTENYTFDVAGVQYAITHDDNGNITRKRNIETGQVWIYEWDSLNRLLAIQSHELPEWESTRSEFTYDGQSRRVGRKELVWRGNWQVDSENKYVWVGSKIAQKRSADGSVLEASFTGFGEKRLDENGAKADYYYTRDHLGSVREVVDDSGAVKARYSYDPWGRRSKIEGEEDFEVEFGYTGHHFHEESKLHLTWYRAYDAGLGRWLSADTIGEDGGLNLYGYVGNDPINHWDPLGLKEYDLGDGWTCRTDQFNEKGKASFETHLYKDGKEVGISNEKGWIARHGHSGKRPPGVPDSIVNKVNGINVNKAREIGRLPPKDITPKGTQPKSKPKHPSKQCFPRLSTGAMAALGEAAAGLGATLALKKAYEKLKSGQELSFADRMELGNALTQARQFGAAGRMYPF